MKFCTACGSQLEDDAKFCTSCGASCEAPACEAPACACEAPVYEEPVAVGNTAEQQAATKSALITSIVGAALSELGIPGWIVSGIARKKCKKAIAEGVTGGKLKAANIISRIGLPISIVMTFFWIIYIIVIAFVTVLASKY